MFDIEKFVTEVCEQAYPTYGNADGETLSELGRGREIECLESEQESLETEKAELETEKTELETEQTGLKADQKVKTDIDELQEISDRLTQIEERIIEIDNRIIEIDNRVVEIVARLNQISDDNFLVNYPLRNKWTCEVSDILNIPRPETVTPNLIVATWRLAGVDRNEIDAVQSGVNFEVMVNASEVVALNAFHWSLMWNLQRHNGLRLSDLIGDVEEDEPVGKTMQWNSRAFRVWGLTVTQLVTGMNVLFNEVEVKQ